MWPFDLSKGVGQNGVGQNGINETQFVNIREPYCLFHRDSSVTVGKWLNTKAYVDFDLMYPSCIRVSHLKKLFRLYTSKQKI
jgi:hypothetical protein